MATVRTVPKRLTVTGETEAMQSAATTTGETEAIQASRYTMTSTYPNDAPTR